MDNTKPNMFSVSWAPKYVGSYMLGNNEYSYRIALTYKPNWLHRTMMRLCFGWTWKDD